ncbi:MAG: 2Fe-2S iron-sulfur cluster-binding protein [Holophaga sp.]|nr:2Fe-2S iron-sulfur cluster-binding protein [Holophaga sp.]
MSESPFPDAPGGSSPSTLSRREFLQSSVTAVAIAGVPLASAQFTTLAAASQPAEAGAPFAERVPVVLRINGRRHDLSLEPRVTLLDTLRETLGLTGTKKGCDHGQCGACTVLADGRRINSCLTLAIMHEGEEITTVEGLERDGQLAPLQAAFIQCDAFQCGYCTSGQLCSATALLAELRAGDASAVSAVSADVRQPRAEATALEIRERLSGNLCRCGAYPNIVTAVLAVLAGGGRASA